MGCSTPGFLPNTSSWSLLKSMSIESVMPSNHLILCRPLLILPSILHVYYKHGCTNIYLYILLHPCTPCTSLLSSLRYMLRSGIAESHDHVGFDVWFFEDPPYYFPEQLCHFVFPPAMYKASIFSTFLPMLVVRFSFLCILIISNILDVKWF